LGTVQGLLYVGRADARRKLFQTDKLWPEGASGRRGREEGLGEAPGGLQIIVEVGEILDLLLEGLERHVDHEERVEKPKRRRVWV
jgi:hypothetical protein